MSMADTKKVIMVLIVCIGGIVGGRQALVCAVEHRDPQYLFYKANTAYENAEYVKAIASYEEILAQGKESGNIYYNIGNCYFKMGELGHAILFYERARRLMPRDGDLISNYNYAQTLVKETVSERREMVPVRVLHLIFKNLSLDELSITASVLFVLCMIWLTFMVVFRRRQWYSIIALCVVFVALLATVFSTGLRIQELTSRAVVVSEKVNAKFEPFDRATTHFSLYEGMSVVIRQSKNLWYKVKRADGTIGWVRKEAVEIV